MKKTPLTERIERYLAWNPGATRILIHPDDIDECLAKRLRSKFDLPIVPMSLPTE